MVSRGAPRTGTTEEEVPPGVWGPVCCWVVTTMADTQARVLDTPSERGENDTNKTTTKDSVMAQRQAKGGGGGLLKANAQSGRPEASECRASAQLLAPLT